MQKIYIETTIPSYYTARPSKIPKIHENQILTKRFWAYATNFFELFISEAVLIEIDLGDQKVAQIRKDVIAEFKSFKLSPDIKKLAHVYVKLLYLPESAQVDATHLAVACLHKMDFLITWNCKHIANAQNFKKIQEYNDKHKIHTPIITTPELFMGGGK